MNKRQLATLIFLLTLVPVLSSAHHNFRSVYNFNETQTIEGSFVSLELVNPHARIFVDVMNDAGEVEQWVIEGPGKLALARRGWTDDMFSAGERITATGNPASSGGNAIWIEKIVREQGVEIIDPLVEDNLAIEAERRARRRTSAR